MSLTTELDSLYRPMFYFRFFDVSLFPLSCMSTLRLRIESILSLPSPIYSLDTHARLNRIFKLATVAFYPVNLWITVALYRSLNERGATFRISSQLVGKSLVGRLNDGNFALKMIC